jgi:WXG100 family type VII secretion target
MGGSLRSDSAELRAVRQLVIGIVDEMRAESDRLAQHGDQLAEGWLGASAKKFRPPWDEWKQGCTAVVDALEAESGLLGESADEYEQQEGANRDSLSQVDVRFNW